jgi:hypothetical protein
MLDIPFPMVYGTSHNSSWFESYGLTKLENPHMLARSPKRSTKSKCLQRRNYSIIKRSDKVKEDFLNNKVNGELSNYGKWLTLK